MTTNTPTRKELLDAIQEAATWLDGLCVGHPVADQQRHELAAKLFQLCGADNGQDREPVWTPCVTALDPDHDGVEFD